MNKYIALISVFFAISLSCLLGSKSVLPAQNPDPSAYYSFAPPIRITVQYKVLNPLTGKFRKTKTILDTNHDLSVQEVLESLNRSLRIPFDNLKVRLGNSRRDRKNLRPITIDELKKAKTIKVRYVPPKSTSNN